MEKIAVEIKSFIGRSDLDEFEDALGQFLIYFVALEEIEQDRRLYLALPEGFYNRFFDDVFFVKLTQRFQIKILIFREDEPNILQWIN